MLRYLAPLALAATLGVGTARPQVARMNCATWAAQGDGTIVHRWQTSIDGGRSWKLQFNRLLRRIAE